MEPAGTGALLRLQHSTKTLSAGAQVAGDSERAHLLPCCFCWQHNPAGAAVSGVSEVSLLPVTQNMRPQLPAVSPRSPPPTAAQPGLQAVPGGGIHLQPALLRAGTGEDRTGRARGGATATSGTTANSGPTLHANYGRVTPPAQKMAAARVRPVVST